eukprot:15483436-Alexandrium_andersonii.AAC.1
MAADSGEPCRGTFRISRRKGSRPTATVGPATKHVIPTTRPCQATHARISPEQYQRQPKKANSLVNPDCCQPTPNNTIRESG